jgi:hypothetical protein
VRFIHYITTLLGIAALTISGCDQSESTTSKVNRVYIGISAESRSDQIAARRLVKYELNSDSFLDQMAGKVIESRFDIDIHHPDTEVLLGRTVNADDVETIPAAMKSIKLLERKENERALINSLQRVEDILRQSRPGDRFRVVLYTTGISGASTHDELIERSQVISSYSSQLSVLCIVGVHPQNKLSTAKPLESLREKLVIAGGSLDEPFCSKDYQ